MKHLPFLFVFTSVATIAFAAPAALAQSTPSQAPKPSGTISAADQEALDQEAQQAASEAPAETDYFFPQNETDFFQEGETPWTINGDLTFDASTYHTNGNKAASPYQSTGGQYYSTLNTFFRKDFSAYRNMSGRFSLLANDSDYRSTFKNLTVEQFSLSYENGEGAIPYAIDFGDIYASFSARSLQVPIKGAMIEFQPGGDDAAWLQSISLLAGFDQGVYREIDMNDSVYAGASWLLEHETKGSLLFNTVQNFKDSSALNAKSLNQNVTSVAGATDFTIGGQSLSAEAEVAAFYGDLADAANPANILENKFDHGLFTRLGGYSASPLDYSVSFERYGEHYNPAGAVITPNQSTLESNIGWRFANGLRLSGRQMRVESDLESPNPLVEKTYGARLSGPLFSGSINGLSGTLDGDYTRLEDKTGVTDTDTYTVGLNVQKVLNDKWTSRYSFRGRKNDNHVTNNTTKAQDHSLTFDHVWSWGDVNGVISPGIAFIHSTDNTRSDRQIGPQFTASANLNNHSVSGSYQFRQIDQKPPEMNIFTDSATLRYAYTIDQHTLALSGDYFSRDLTNNDTHAYRVGLSYTVSFNYTGNTGRTSGRAGASSAHESAYSDILLLPRLGQSPFELRSASSAHDLAPPRKMGNLEVIDGRPLPRINLRQQVMYAFKNNALYKHAVVFEPASENPSVLSRDFQSALNEMIRTFGRPSSSYENGRFGPTLAEDLASGQFRRMYEWNKDGRIIRFGIPRRLDNQIRFELVGATSFSTPGNPLWGIDSPAASAE